MKELSDNLITQELRIAEGAMLVYCVDLLCGISSTHSYCGQQALVTISVIQP